LRRVGLCLLILVTLGSGCAGRGARRRGPDDLTRVLAQADALVGKSQLTVGGQRHRSDCSGFVQAAYSAAGLDLIGDGAGGSSGSEAMYRTLKQRGRLVPDSAIRPGDLLFFHNTWDRNGNGIRDDRFSHVALAEAVDREGTVTFVHFASGRVKRDVLNLRHPEDATGAGGATWNSTLRRGRGKVLAGQLFFRAGRPLPR
jgi:cell wall-associated NlpC family hydrolase